jgi:hypothetical protein
VTLTSYGDYSGVIGGPTTPAMRRTRSAHERVRQSIEFKSFQAKGYRLALNSCASLDGDSIYKRNVSHKAAAPRG